MDNWFGKIKEHITASVGTVLLIYQLAQAFAGNGTLLTGILILVALLFLGTGMKNYAFAKSTIPGIPRYRLYWAARIALIFILILLILSIVYIFTILNVISDYFGFVPTDTPASTSTPTLTMTVPPTFTWTPSPPPASRSHYYMIVLDASVNMQESFDGQSKWSAALNSLHIILEGLNRNSNYGLVVVGGSSVAGATDPCSEPLSPTIPFTSDTEGLFPAGKLRMDNLIAQINTLQPAGGGSLSTAFNLAKNQLEDLPANTVTSLVFITSSSDTCESRDEWDELEKAIKFFGGDVLYSEIIILDEEAGIIIQDIAQRLGALSTNINVQVSQNNQQLQQVSGNVVSQVNTHVEQQQIALSNPVAGSSTPIPANTSTSQTIVSIQAPAITIIPPTAVPPTPVPPTKTSVPQIAWDLSSPDGRYGALFYSDSTGTHYRVFEKQGNRLIFTTHALYTTNNDVKAGQFSPDSSKFAAAYHYKNENDEEYTWIGIWSIAAKDLVNELVKPGFVLDLSDVFN